MLNLARKVSDKFHAILATTQVSEREVDFQILPRAERIRIEAIYMAIQATPCTILESKDLTQAKLLSRAKDFEIFIKAARDDS